MCSLLLFEVLALVDEAALENILKSVAKNISEDNLRFAELDLKTAKGMAPEDPRVWYYDGVVKATGTPKPWNPSTRPWTLG